MQYWSGSSCKMPAVKSKSLINTWTKTKQCRTGQLPTSLSNCACVQPSMRFTVSVIDRPFLNLYQIKAYWDQDLFHMDHLAKGAQARVIKWAAINYLGNAKSCHFFVDTNIDFVGQFSQGLQAGCSASTVQLIYGCNKHLNITKTSTKCHCNANR